MGSDDGEDRWRWREVSLRRVAGTMMMMLGFVVLATDADLAWQHGEVSSATVVWAMAGALAFVAGYILKSRASRPGPRA